MRVKNGQLLISLKVPLAPLEGENFHSEIISPSKFDTVTHLEQVTNFDLF